VSLGRIPISARSNPAQSGTARLESCLDAREGGLLEKNRRGECTSARYEVARSDRDSRPAGQQADPRRAIVEYASLDADDVAGAIRPHREARIGEDRAVRDGRDIGSTLGVDTAGIEGDERVIDEGMASVRAARHIDAVPGEIPDRAADDIDLFAGGNAHAIKARPKPLDVEPFKHDLVGCPGTDDDTVRSRHQHARFDVIGANGDRLGDGNRAEAAGIEHVDLAARGGLGNRARESLAWRRAAARICVVTDAGDPGSGRLRVRHGGEADHKSGGREEAEDFRRDHRG
jgi:hypothetical protein